MLGASADRWDGLTVTVTNKGWTLACSERPGFSRQGANSGGLSTTCSAIADVSGSPTRSGRVARPRSARGEVNGREDRQVPQQPRDAAVSRFQSRDYYGLFQERRRPAATAGRDRDRGRMDTIACRPGRPSPTPSATLRRGDRQVRGSLQAVGPTPYRCSLSSAATRRGAEGSGTRGLRVCFMSPSTFGSPRALERPPTPKGPDEAAEAAATRAGSARPRCWLARSDPLSAALRRLRFDERQRDSPRDPAGRGLRDGGWCELGAGTRLT